MVKAISRKSKRNLQSSRPSLMMGRMQWVIRKRLGAKCCAGEEVNLCQCPEVHKLRCWMSLGQREGFEHKDAN